MSRGCIDLRVFPKKIIVVSIGYVRRLVKPDRSYVLTLKELDEIINRPTEGRVAATAVPAACGDVEIPHTPHFFELACHHAFTIRPDPGLARDE